MSMYSGQLQICSFKKKKIKAEGGESVDVEGAVSVVISRTVQRFTIRYTVASKSYSSLTVKCDFQHSVKTHHYFI